MYLNYFRGLEGHGEAKTGLPEPMKDHGEAKIDSPQPADTVAVSKHVLPVTQENSSANLTTFLGVVSPPSKVLTISDAMISRGQLKYLVSWLPSCYMIKDLRRLRSPGFQPWTYHQRDLHYTMLGNPFSSAVMLRYTNHLKML